MKSSYEIIVRQRDGASPSKKVESISVLFEQILYVLLPRDTSYVYFYEDTYDPDILGVSTLLTSPTEIFPFITTTIIAPASVDAMEVRSAEEENFYEKHLIRELDVSKDAPECNDKDGETRIPSNEGNAEENLRETVRNGIASKNVKDNCNEHEDTRDNEVPDSSIKSSWSDEGRNDPDTVGGGNNVEDDNSDTTERVLKRLSRLVDSDSEEEINSDGMSNKKESLATDYHSGSGSIENAQHAECKKDARNKGTRRIIDSESEEDIQESNADCLFETVNKSTRTISSNYRALIDSESEEEKEEVTYRSSSTVFDNTDILGIKSVKEKPVKKRKGSIRASKEEAMRQIHSETQRFLRETEVSLPYHRPKQRTLQEFLSRKKLLTALPKASSTAAKLKMSSAIVSQALAEKEKEAELFYKSSDSEDDVQFTSSVSKNEESILETNKKMPSVDIKCTFSRKVETNNPDTHNKNEMIQNHVDLGIFEVLSEEDHSKAGCQDKELPTLSENNSNRNDKSDILAQQLIKECKQKLQKDSVSRKLFDENIENETSEVSNISYHQQEAMNEKVDAIIASLDKEKSIDDRQEAEHMTENHISKISQARQCVAEMTDKSGDENLSTEMMKKSDCPINNKQIDEMFHRDNATSNVDVTSAKSDGYIIMQDGNRKRRNKCVEMDDMSQPSTSYANVQSKVRDNLLIEENKESDGHVLGLPLPKFTETLYDRKKSPLQSVPSAKITLKGSPGMIIDLTDNGKSSGKGVNTLLDRFFHRHIVYSNKQTANNKSEITVVHLQDTPNGPTPVKEILPYTLPNNIDKHELSKPGAKLMRLKEDLKLQMTLKRDKEWKQKEIELQEEKEQEDEEDDYDDLDKHENAESCESSDNGESEPEENDVYIKDKKRSKCLFADDEAEVTDDENLNVSAEEEEEVCNESDMNDLDEQSTSIKHGNKTGHNNNLIEIENEEEDELYVNMEDGKENSFKNDDCKIGSVNRNKKKKKAKQLIQEFQDDSNITSSDSVENANNQSKNITDIVDKFKKHHNDNSISENENDISIFQHHAEAATGNQVCKTPVTKTSMLDFVSPITQLSVLNTTLNSNKADKSEKRELVDKYEIVSIEDTQSDKTPEFPHNIKNKTISQRKLFDDVGETIDDEYLMQLCSGTFGFTQKTDLDVKDIFSESDISKSQSRENCNAKSSDMEQLEDSEVKNENSQDTKLVLNENVPRNSVDHLKELRKDNTMDSALKFRIVSSDDENQSDEENTFLRFKKRPVKRLDLSDSEEEDDQFSDAENDDINDKEGKSYVDYDSEENEIIVASKKDIKETAADFVEEEAELSESDWDSADEDEKGLNELELEEGDDELIDEDEVKDQLEKIHRKQILDEDKREVKLLQELLFEDGDLHTDGTGRERKFRWKNIGKLENETTRILDENDDWIDAQEEEEEAQWSKLRHERDKFLEERMKNSSNGIEDELYNSQIFKLGLQALKKIKNNDREKQNVSLDKIDLSENMEPITPQNITDLLNIPNTGKKSQTIYNVIKKRSLLTRGEESLARIASLAKQSDPVSHMVNARNFVFQYIDSDVDSTSKKNGTRENEWDSQDIQNKPRKRKMTSNFSSSMKRKRN